MKTTADVMRIDMLRDLPDMIPVLRDSFENWSVRVFNREQHECRNYLSPNRRDFYKVLLITRGTGVFTMGLNTYFIEEPTILFIHPNDIISWRKLSEEEPGGYYVLFKRSYINDHPQLKMVIDKYGLFSEKEKSVIRLLENETATMNGYFAQMKAAEREDSAFAADAIQAYLQLLMIESMKVGRFPGPDSVTEDFGHIHHFFTLLETETAKVNYSQPIRIKTAKEFASDLHIHPNYLNELLKKHTGENTSTHIRNRILEEAKALLLQTDWSLEDISYSVGFSGQPNFTLFFKKNTGITPAAFRKSHQA